jgi:cytidyltransferase-like protein
MAEVKIEDDGRVFVPPFLKEKFVATLPELAAIREDYRNRGLRVALTQGVWDLLHRGHLRYIYAASQMADIVIVGVDDDALTRRRKPEPGGRPAVPQDERLEMLAYVPFIHHLILRSNDDDIGELIRTVRPDVLIVSKTTSDFPENLIATYNECCGRIVRLAEQARTSSTERLRQEAIHGEATGKRHVINMLRDLITTVETS